MKNKFFLALIAAFSLICGAFAVEMDRLAVAEPVNKGGIKTEDVEAIWGMLESSIGGDYEVISRAALKQIMTEIGLTTSSDLMNLNSAQKARLGQIKTVKYLLVPTVGKFGSRITLSLSLMNSSTGSIDPDGSISKVFRNFDELADQLKDTLNEIGLGKKARKRGISAVLSPVIALNDAPAYLPMEFNTLMENGLLNSGIQLFAMQNISNILAKNKIDAIHSASPAMYQRIGELLRADYLVQATINRFTIGTKSIYVAPLQKYVTSYNGYIAGTVKIINAQTGLTAGSFVFDRTIDFGTDLPDHIDNTNWLTQDYARYLIRTAITPIVSEVAAKIK